MSPSGKHGFFLGFQGNVAGEQTGFSFRGSHLGDVMDVWIPGHSMISMKLRERMRQRRQSLVNS